jgi:glycosyltransferase involved in cell wall biosynthesis
LARRTDVLVSVGERVKHELLEVGIGNQTKFEVVPPGFPIAESSLNQSRSLQLGSELLKCAWIGRIVEVKAPERVLEIARLLSKKKSDVQFLMAGDGPLRREIQHQSESESLPIKFLGWVPDVPALLKEVDLLILTSLNEGTPLSIIEAQRMGKPVLATDVGSVREIVSDRKSGHVLDFDASEFADFIDSFATDRFKLQEFSKDAIKFSGEKFAPERLAKDYLRIYKELISN